MFNKIPWYDAILGYFKVQFHLVSLALAFLHQTKFVDLPIEIFKK